MAKLETSSVPSTRLFTGLALIGLVYTASLQRDQTRAQEKESSRQAREQLLTARLNARIATLQGITAQASILMSDANQSRERDAPGLLAALTNYRVQIDILASEVNQGFDGGVWSDSVEKEAIRQYIVNSLGTFVAAFELATRENDLSTISGLPERASKHFQAIKAVIYSQYPVIAVQCDSIIELFRRNPSDPAQAVEWCRGAADHLQRGQFPWV